MKPKHFIKKYKLDTRDTFNHNQFSVDFGTDFMSRLEVYKTFNGWGVNRFFDLVSEMRKKFETIDLKCKVQLPEKLWSYMKNAIFMEIFDEEFPETAEDRDELRKMNVSELKQWLESQSNLFKSKVTNTKITKYAFVSNVSLADFEWDRNYQENVIGSLGLKPNYRYNEADEMIYQLNDYLVNCAWIELTYQLKKVAAAKARIQFKINREWEQKEKEFRKARWNWFSFIHESLKGFQVDKSEYVPYMSILNLTGEFKENEVKESYRKLSLLKHPDKGGSHEDFIELTEAKNKCLEYLSRIN